jgi:hypothetical protein
MSDNSTPPASCPPTSPPPSPANSSMTPEDTDLLRAFDQDEKKRRKDHHDAVHGAGSYEREQAEQAGGRLSRYS